MNAYEQMMDALAEISNLADAMLWECQDANAIAILDKCRDALALPRRNCDVGTAEEQTARYRKFCSAHKYLGNDSSYMCKGFGKGRCPSFNHTKSLCEIAWGQMPYTDAADAEGCAQ